MPTISNTITATTGYAVTLTSADPVLNVTDIGAVLAVGAYGIVTDTEVAPYSADITIDGFVFATGAGIWFRENGGSVTVTEDAVVRSGSQYGIVSFVNSTVSIDIVNAGKVLGNSGISLGGADDSIDNSGTIRSFSGAAIYTVDGNDTVTNSGKIIGDVLLGNDDDTFIAKTGGTVNGTVNGGAGDDTYKIINNNLTLADDSGIDTIRSTVSHTLGADFENLRLLGTKDRDGTGNASQNVLVGNDGNNKLKGLDGGDTLKGGKGNDILLGGAGRDTLEGGRGKDVYNGGNGNDTFVFGTNSGKDKIRDFNPNSGAEDVDLSKMASITGYSDLTNNHMTQVGQNVVINGGGGDKLTLVGIDIGDLDAGDFLF